LKLKARGNNYIKTEYKDGKTEKKRTQKENERMYGMKNG